MLRSTNGLDLKLPLEDHYFLHELFALDLVFSNRLFLPLASCSLLLQLLLKLVAPAAIEGRALNIFDFDRFLRYIYQRLILDSLIAGRTYLLLLCFGTSVNSCGTTLSSVGLFCSLLNGS